MNTSRLIIVIELNKTSIKKTDNYW